MLFFRGKEILHRRGGHVRSGPFQMVRSNFKGLIRFEFMYRVLCLVVFIPLLVLQWMARMLLAFAAYLVLLVSVLALLILWLEPGMCTTPPSKTFTKSSTRYSWTI